MTVSAEVLPAVDPITYEVIRHRLMAIVAQQSVVLKNVSGSPVVTDANDCNTGIYLPDGEIVAIGPHIVVHAGSMSLVVDHILADCAENPGIAEGDTFITSDPYKGAMHMPDVTLLEPIFYDGRRVAWVGACAHELDVGGMTHSSWCPQATEYIQEGLILPPTKLVEGGNLRRDVWNLILAGTRLPGNLGLDLRAMIAANTHGKRGLLRLFERYGVDVVTAVMAGMLDRSEEQLRERLRRLPDGRFRARNFLEHDGHSNRLYVVEVEVAKRGDVLQFDYSRSSEQAPGFINCTESGLRGGVTAAVLSLLCPDIPWNGGALRPVEIEAPEGLLVNARRPAPCSSATLAGAWLVEKTAAEAVSKLLSCSDDLRHQATALSVGSISIMHMVGINQYGEHFGGALTEALMGGGGATATHSGLDYGGPPNILTYAVPNVENAEAVNPILYLRHGTNRDSGGAGRRRGGVSAGSAWTVHDAPFLMAVLLSHGVEVPTTLGIHGGHPGSCHRFALVRGSDVNEQIASGSGPTGAEELAGEHVPLGAKPGVVRFEPGDVLDWTWHGGGGWGDPIEADPAAIVDDVASGFVSAASAEALYGVVVTDGRLDADGTERRRAEIRAERKSWPASRIRRVASDGEMIVALGERLAVVRSSEAFATRCACGAILAEADENWKAYAAKRVLDPDELGPKIALHEELEARGYACPSCGTLHAVEIARPGESPLHDVALDLGGHDGGC